MEEQNKTREDEQNESLNNEDSHNHKHISEDDVASTEPKESEKQSTKTETVSSGEVIDDKDVEENKFIAALSYLGILVLVPLLVKKDSKFAQFHAKQGLIFLVIWVVGWIFFLIPLFGQILALTILVLNIIALVQALNGKYWEVPVIGDFAKKIKL